ncbi:MAG: hypothetical protein Q4F07_09875 [Bacteroidales bacterium]|nr:hypothetical protein [Bacteroidales bacterium]
MVRFYTFSTAIILSSFSNVFAGINNETIHAQTIASGEVSGPHSGQTQGAIPDSLDVQQLDEVIVDRTAQEIKPAVTVYYPENNQKKSAQNGMDLLQQMAIPQIRVNPVSNSVLTLNGQKVDIYIDMQPASQDLMEALNPEDVKKVEYLVYPTDPRFQHNHYVVSITLRKKEFGGYSKLTGRGNIMAGSGSGTAYGKMAYKSMTYDFIVSDKYTDRHHQGSDRTQVFRFPDADGTLKSVKRENIIGNSRLQQNNLGASFRAIYQTEKVSISNILSLDVTNRPKLDTDGTVVFTPDIYRKSDYSSSSSQRVLYPTWTGNFFFDMGKGYKLNAVTQLQYQDTKSDSYYRGAGQTAITNNARAKAHMVQILLQLNKEINEHNVVDLNTYYIINNDKVTYTGTTQSTDRFRQLAYGAMAGYTLQSGMFYGRLESGVIGERNKIVDKTMSDIVPLFNLSCQYAFNQKNSIEFAARYNVNFVDQSDKTPTLLQENELLYKTGNPDLKNTHWSSVDLSYTWLPNNKFQVSASGGWSRYFDRPVPLFTPTAPDGMMLRQIINDGDCQNFDVGVSATARLFNRSLVLQLQPRMWFGKLTGIYSDTYNYLMVSASATYYLKSFYANLYYSTADRGLVQYSLNDTFYRSKSAYQFKIGWRNKNWNISVAAVNIFRKNWIDQTSSLKSQYFDQYNTVYNSSSHQFVNITGTYTFSFGKKVNKGDEIQTVTSSGSAIMK